MGGSSKKVTVGYKYYVGMHMGLCHGPVDKIVRIRVGGRDAWVGNNTGGALTIDNPDLFGGEKREGGVSGQVDIERGGPTQGQNSYLASKLGADLLPAFRGVCCAVLRQVYVGLNPYLKDWGWLPQRILTRSNGEEQWYPEKAAINEYKVVAAGKESTETGVVYCLEPNAGGWSYVYDIRSEFTSADIPDSGGTYKAPFVGSWPPWNWWYPAVTLPKGRAFSQYAEPGEYTIVDGNAPAVRWSAISVKLVDLSTVYIAWQANDSSGLYINDVDTGASGGGLYSYTPTGTTIKITIKHPNSGFDGFYAYWNVAVWQNAEIGNYQTNYVSQDEKIVVYEGSRYEVIGKITGTTSTWNEFFDLQQDGDVFMLSHINNFVQYENRPPTGIGDTVICYDGIVREVGPKISGTLHPEATACMNAPADWFWNGNGYFDHYITRQVHPCTAERHEGYVVYQEYTRYTMRYLDGGQGQYSDMNPAHIIRECLTDSNWGMGYPESDMGDSFVSAADRLYSEGMGISILWSQQTSIEDFVEEIIRHIDAAIYVNRATGKFELKLIRDDYVVDDLLVLDQSNISRVEGYSKQTLAELVNEVTVTYNSNETGQVETVTLQNLAMIQQQGAIIPASVEYMGFANQAIAARAATRDLKAMSTPLVTAVLYANREAAGLNIGSVFRWNWVETDEDGNGIATSYIMRVTEIAFGDGVDNTVRIQCVQDVFALPDIVYVEAEQTEWTDPSASPLPATPRLAMETPYYEIVRKLGEVDAAAKLSGLPELGYLMIAAGRPAAEINAELQIDAGAGYAEGGTLDFCPCAALDGAIGYLDTTATLKDGVDLDEFAAGSLAQIDNEIVVIESITDGVATIRRGCLDTVPATHADGASVIIWDGYAASDDIEYVASDEVDVKILTITGQGPLAIADAPIDSVVMDQRAIRPYPPANVKIGGEYFPDLIAADDLVGIVATWSHRDRMQQTGGTVIGWTDASVGPESGVTYSARLVRTDTEVELDSSAAISGTTVTFTPSYRGEVRLEVWSERDGLESMQMFSHAFLYTAVAPAYYDSAAVYYDGNEVYYEL